MFNDDETLYVYSRDPRLISQIITRPDPPGARELKIENEANLNFFYNFFLKN